MPVVMEKTLMYNGKRYSFQVDAPIVQEIRNSRNNFLIQYDEQCLTRDYCAVYFSSNDIYFPNAEDVFRKRIIEKDFFEWYGTRVKKAYKHIFLRDIYKQWYLKGVSGKIDDPEKLLAWVKKETKGYKVIAVGSSAGGYAATLYGNQLDAERILAFNPQFELNSLFDRSDEHKNPILFRLRNTEWVKYFDILPLIASSPKGNVFYFYSIKSPWDAWQYKHLGETQGIHRIGFNTSHHGIPFLKVALPSVLNMESRDLIQYENKQNNPLFFTIKMVGIKKSILGLYQQIIGIRRRRK